MSKGLHGSLWAIALVVGVLLYLTGRYAGQAEAAFSDWTGTVNAELHAAGLRKAQGVLLERRLAANEAHAQGLLAILEHQRAQLDSLKLASLHGDSVAIRQFVTACYAGLDTCRARGDTLQAEVASLKEAHGNDQLALAHSDSLLALGLKVKECPGLNLLVVHVGCPSRTMLFFLGAGLTEGLHIVFSKP
jgi:hypothetical protein